MNILGIDTSTKKANVCLEYNNKIIDKSIDNEITHSEKLLPLVDDVLKSENTSPKGIDYLACCTGPGSFTGIRIGIATVKAFAKTLNAPIFAVSSLDVLAYTNITSDYVLSIMDAKNSRIYYSVYKIERKECNNILVPYLERICDYANDNIDVALEKISSVFSDINTDTNTSITIIGDCVDNYKDMFIPILNSKFTTINTDTQNLSGQVLVSMLKNYIKLGIDSDYKKDYLTLDAIYVRPSQAERAKNNEI